MTRAPTRLTGGRGSTAGGVARAGAGASLLSWGFAALLWASATVSPADVEGQLLDDRLVPSGTMRLSGWPSFTAWDQRFGDEGRVPLGAGLSSPSALDLFPGSADFEGEMRELLGDPEYTPVVGSVDGRASHDVTRIDIGIHLGLTDWWTVGALIPRIKNRTAIDLVFTPDTLAGDLGLSPRITGAGVDPFLLDLETARTDATARAEGLCSLGDPDCASATALAERAARLSDGLTTLYTVTPFFPLETSSAGTVLASDVAALDAELRAAGLGGIDAPFVLATERPTEGDLGALPVRHLPLGYGEPLRTRTSLWGLGDIELSTLFRVLQLGDRGADVPAWSIDVLAGALVRLGTGKGPDPDIPLALGTGDGQTDVEVRASAHAVAGRHVSLRAGGLYGVQGSRVLARRVGIADEDVLIPLERRGVFEWSPGRYLGLEAEPGLRLAPELTLSVNYRFLRQDAPAFTLSDGSAPVPVGRRSSLHRVGGALTYDTTAPRLDTRPLRFRLRVLRAIAGTRSPAATRIELSGELFARIWGG